MAGDRAAREGHRPVIDDRPSAKRRDGVVRELSAGDVQCRAIGVEHRSGFLRGISGKCATLNIQYPAVVDRAAAAGVVSAGERAGTVDGQAAVVCDEIAVLNRRAQVAVDGAAVQIQRDRRPCGDSQRRIGTEKGVIPVERDSAAGADLRLQRGPFALRRGEFDLGHRTGIVRLIVPVQFLAEYLQGIGAANGQVAGKRQLPGPAAVIRRLQAGVIQTCATGIAEQGGDVILRPGLRAAVAQRQRSARRGLDVCPPADGRIDVRPAAVYKSQLALGAAGQRPKFAAAFSGGRFAACGGREKENR